MFELLSYILFHVLIKVILLIAFIALIVAKITKIGISQYKKLFLIVSFILVLLTIFFTTDYILTQNEHLPLFCIEFFYEYQDGGTVVYYGLGYKVIDFHKIESGGVWGNMRIFICVHYGCHMMKSLIYENKTTIINKFDSVK